MPEKASHPKYMDMVKEAIRKNYSAKGTSRQKIKSFIEQTYHIQALNNMLRATLEKAAVEGEIEKTSDGSRYRLTSKGRLSMDKKKKEKKVSKAASAPKKAVKKAAGSKTKKPRKTAVKVKKVVKPALTKKVPAKAKKPLKASTKSTAKPTKKASMKKATKPKK
jgi:histone H1/5